MHFRDIMSKQLKDKPILAVTNDISLALNNQVLNVLPGDKVLYEEMDKIICDDTQDQLTLKNFQLSNCNRHAFTQITFKKIECIIMWLKSRLGPIFRQGRF